MIIETKEIYKCEYCRKLYQLKRFAESHELICKKNPENRRACFGCKFLTKKDIEVEVDGYYGPYNRTYNLLFCEKKNIHLYPPKIEINQNWIVDDENEPMPRECELRENFEFN